MLRVGQLVPGGLGVVPGVEMDREIAGQWADFTLQNAVLEDGTLASDALETGPPSHPNAHITGIYTLANPAAAKRYSTPRSASAATPVITSKVLRMRRPQRTSCCPC